MRAWEFPFTKAAQEQVRSEGYSIESLLERRSFHAIRLRAAERVAGAIGGEIQPSNLMPEVEILSYPIARIMISCLNNDHLTRRYALAESKLAYRQMRGLLKEELLELSSEFGLDVDHDGDLFRIHFSSYVSLAARMKSPHWKLVNRPLRQGYISITSEDLMRLMEERARERVQKGLPLHVTDEMCNSLGPYTKSLKSQLEFLSASRRADLGEVKDGAFPPCIKMMLAQVSSGANLAHTARFALTSFLLNIGMTVDKVVAIFSTSPDFDEDRTRYQVDHIYGSSGTRYKPPACATMATYGNCPGEDNLCKRIRHPLSYYERRARQLDGMQGERKPH